MRVRWFIAIAVGVAHLTPAGCASTGDPAHPTGANPPGPSDGGSSGAIGETGGIGDAPKCTQIPLPNGAPVHVTGTVIEAGDAAAPKPIPNAMISVEYGGLYLGYCDMAHASPYYLFGAYTDANGRFEIDVKEGKLGFHSFATGYYYSRAALDTSQAKTVTISMELLPAAQGKPTVANAKFDQPTVAPGAPVTFSADVRAPGIADPLSDELVLVEATRSFSLELDPPGVGKKDNFPDGLWKRTFNAPATAGTYTYYFSATTGTCVTSDLQSFTLQVK